MKPARELRVPRQTSAILPSIHQKSNWPAVATTHGWPVLQDVKSVEERSGFDDVFLAEFSDGPAQTAGQIDESVTDRAEGVGRVPRAHSTRVFAEPSVQHIEAAVFDVPTSAKAFEQVRRIGFLTGQTGDGVRHAVPHLTLFRGLPFQTN